MQCFKRCVLGILSICALAIVLAAFAAYHVAAWLSAADAPQRADAIIVLGDDPTRVIEGADLYRAGFAPRVLLSTPARSRRHLTLEEAGLQVLWFEEAGRTILLRRGVPDSAIATFGTRLRSTVEEARAVRALYNDRSARPTLLVVTSPYHVRRARIIFRDALPDARVLVEASHYEPYPDRWWTDRHVAPQIVLECVKLAAYTLGIRR
jgi:uncharacterized SAM-binding protein YcdF (DUF218 family)